MVSADVSDPARDFHAALRDAGVNPPADPSQPLRQASDGEGFMVRGSGLDLHTRAVKCMKTAQVAGLYCGCDA